MIMIIKNARLILPDRVVCGSAEFDGERIVRVTEGDHSVSPGEVLDANGMYLCPGFVDIHVHGGNGFSTYEQPEKAADYFLQRGTTTLLAAPAYFLGFDELIEKSDKLMYEEKARRKEKADC